MPRGFYSNIFCQGKKEEEFVPTKHQTETTEYFLTSPYKGLLLYHKLGSGKTCTSIMIADQLLKKKMVSRVYILTPGSLREGWINEYCRKCGRKASTFYKKYVFITYNYRIPWENIDFTDSLVIIDEVHNLINGVKNDSKTAVFLYNRINESKCRVLALSGTPIYNYVYEFAFLGRLLKPGDDFFPDIGRGEDVNSMAFMKLFDVAQDGTLKPKNDTVFRRMIEGIVSYFPGAGEEYVPTVIEMSPIKVVMSPEQEKYYWIRHDIEISAVKPASGLRKKDPQLYELMRKLYIVAKKNIFTRAASNFYYPPEIKIQQDLPEPKGWISRNNLKQFPLSICSPKFVAFLVNIVMHDKQKHVLFTFFKKKSGVQALKSILGLCGIKTAIFSGDLDDSQRRYILKKFNSEENRYGDLIRVLLVTEAGAEGISVLEARHMHILESSPRMSKTIQAIGRVARFRSHIALPPEERTVKIWKYQSIASPDAVTIESVRFTESGEELRTTKKITNKVTIDEILYDRGMKVLKGIDSFLDLLKASSVTSY